jgi:HAD superfamily hydrolase (TIGR01509 family)
MTFSSKRCDILHVPAEAASRVVSGRLFADFDAFSAINRYPLDPKMFCEAYQPPFGRGLGIMEFGIIYDCDGTLIDSEHIAGSVCAAALTEVGWPITMREFNARFNGVPVKETWNIIRAELPFELPPGFNEAINAEIYRRYETELKSIPGVVEAVQAIEGKRAVASSTGWARLKANLDFTNLTPLFGPHIYSASQVARGKPAPDVFLYAASQIGLDPAHSIVIEDSVAGVIAARRAGMRVIGFTGACHGAEDIGERLAEAGAIDVIEEMRLLPRSVERALRRE